MGWNTPSTPFYSIWLNQKKKLGEYVDLASKFNISYETSLNLCRLDLRK